MSDGGFWQRINLRVKGGSVPIQLLGAQIFVAASALVVNIISARVLGPEGRGELALFMQVAYVLNVVCLLGRDRSYPRFFKIKKSSLPNSQKEIDRLTFFPFLLGLIACFALALIIENQAIAILVFAFSMYILIASGIQQKMHRSAAIVSGNASPFFWSTIIGQVLLVMIAGLFGIYAVDSVSSWLVLYGISVAAPYLVLEIRNRRLAAAQLGLRDVKKVSRLGFRLLPASVAEILGSRADRFLIPFLASYTQLGIYSVVVTMTELVAWPVRAYADSRVPYWSEAITKGKLKTVKETLVIITLILTTGAFVLIALNFLLLPLFGDEYSDGTKLIAPLVIAASLHAFSHFGTNLAIAGSLASLANSIPLVGMAVSIPTYFMLIPTYGALGAAWGLVLGYSISAILVLLCIYIIHKKNVDSI